MKFRIALWASAGFLVAGFWALYFAASKHNPIESIAYLLARWTCPIALLCSHPLSLYSVLLSNAATYALIGLIVETVRRQQRLPTHAN